MRGRRVCNERFHPTLFPSRPACLPTLLPPLSWFLKAILANLLNFVTVVIILFWEILLLIFKFFYCFYIHQDFFHATYTFSIRRPGRSKVKVFLPLFLANSDSMEIIKLDCCIFLWQLQINVDSNIEKFIFFYSETWNEIILTRE